MSEPNTNQVPMQSAQNPPTQTPDVTGTQVAQQATNPQTVQPVQTGQPSTTNGQPTAKPPVPAHKPGLFDRVLQGMAGGPTIVNGQEKPMTRQSLTAHILAGAITGIIQGSAKGYQQPVGKFGSRTGQIAAAAAGTMDAQNAALEEARNKPQAQFDQATMQKAQATKNTLSELQNQRALQTLHSDQYENYEQAYKAHQEAFEPILSDLNDAKTVDGNPLVVSKNQTPEEVMANKNLVAQGLQPVIDGYSVRSDPSTGKEYHVPTYSLVRTGDVQVSPESVKSLSKYNSQLSYLLNEDGTLKTPSNNITLNSAALINYEKLAHASDIALQQINKWQDAMGIDKKDQLTEAQFASKVKGDQQLQQQIRKMFDVTGSAGTLSSDSALDELQQNKTAGKVLDLVAPADDIKSYIDDTQAERLKQKNLAQSAGKIAVQQLKTANQTMTPNLAASILSNPNAAPVDKARAESFHTIQQNWEEQKKRSDEAVDQSFKQGNPMDAAKLLYDGTLTLTELKSRSVTPEFITQVTSMAQNMAKGAGDATWTPQTAEAYFKQAESPKNQQFFGNVNSLMDPNGTLQQLQDEYTKLDNGRLLSQFPMLNSVEDYANYQAGREKSGDAMAGLAQTALAVADDYAKVMGGGVGTDANRLAVLHSFASAHNPSQMAEAIAQARKGVSSQAMGYFNQNPVLMKMYGQNFPEAQQKLQQQQAQKSQQANPMPKKGPDGQIHSTRSMYFDGAQWQKNPAGKMWDNGQWVPVPQQ